MKAGNGIRLLLVVVICLVAVSWCKQSALGQVTDYECCISDSLVLVSPDPSSVSVEIDYAGDRLGALISWADLPDSVATCVVVTDTAGMGVEVRVSGHYSSDVDRELQFYLQNGGEVGTETTNWLPFHWENVGSTISGNVFGDINLSNSGGLWEYDAAADTWQRHNQGLPVSMPRANITTFAQSAADSNFWLIGVSAGAEPMNDSVGLWKSRGDDEQGHGDWVRIAEADLTDAILISSIDISPEQSDWFAIGTPEDGMFTTQDGGDTFLHWMDNLDPDWPPEDLPGFFEVTAVNWETDRLYVAILAFGLFVSDDGGLTFDRVENLEVPVDLDDLALGNKFPNIVCIEVESADHILVGLKDHALYETTDGGDSWHSLTGDTWVVGNPADPGKWKHTGRSVFVDPDDSDTIIVGTDKRGLWRTTDGGVNWDRVADEEGLLPPEVSASHVVRDILFATEGALADQILAIADGLGVLLSEDSGATWEQLAKQPGNPLTRTAEINNDGSGNLLYATVGGGVYSIGSPVLLSETITQTLENQEFWNMQLGISIAFGPGTLTGGSEFMIKAQDFQGWAVWRSEVDDPYALELIGVYDKTNPETCIEEGGYCGDENYIIRPRCFGERRALCFRGAALEDSSETVSFFDDNIFNGFRYNYAVTTFDYGNTALTLVANLSSDQLFSERYPDDPSSTFHVAEYPGSLHEFVVNTEAPDVGTQSEIYCFPNPLRSGAGFTGYEGEQVVFTNVPPQSKIQIFTVAGDEVASLESDAVNDRGNVYWIARNSEGELLAGGVYIYKVETSGREKDPVFGKLVIIR